MKCEVWGILIARVEALVTLVKCALGQVSGPEVDYRYGHYHSYLLHV